MSPAKNRRTRLESLDEISPNLHKMCILGTELDGENLKTFGWEISIFHVHDVF